MGVARIPALCAFLATTASADFIPLNAVTFSGGPRLTVTASPLAADGSSQTPQQLLLDSGSSTLAFCDSSLGDKVKSLKSGYYSCNIYGDAQVKQGYWGPFYKGGVEINKGTVKVPEAHYAIMKQQVKMPCDQGVGGIFGIAFKMLDMDFSTKPDWPAGGLGSCPPFFWTDLAQPLMQYLNSKGGAEKVGIYWSGKQGDGEGKLYIDDAATSNEHYDETAASKIGQAKLGKLGWYDITVQSVDYNGKSYSNITCDEGTCVMDTGTPVLVVPPSAYQAMASGRTGTMSVKLEGASGGSIELKFDVATLLANRWVAPGAQGGGVILGLPVRAFYYSVMDITGSSIAFVPMANL